MSGLRSSGLRRKDVFDGISDLSEEVKSDIADKTRFTKSSPYTYRIGYDYEKGQPSTVKIGGNRAFSGVDGIFGIGGAGPKDGHADIGGNVTYLGALGHPDWPTFQPSIPRNAPELALYSNATTGFGTSTGTTTFTSTSGTFTAADAGRAIWIEGQARTVAAYVSSSQVTLNTSVPAGTNLVWHIAITSGSGTGSLADNVFTRTLGDPFIPHYFGTGFVLRLNGVPYAVTATSGDTYTLASPPAAGSYSYAYETVINDQIAAFRVGPQFQGSDEENLSIIARTMRYEIRPTYAGNGKYRDLVIGSGEYTPGSLAEQIVVGADGRLTLGGPSARPTILIDHSTAASVNYMQMVSAPTGSGPSFRARGMDANVSLNYDTKGGGEHNFTVNTFGNLALKLYGVAGPDYLAIAADNGAPYIAAAGGSANSDVRFLPKGTGLVRFGTLTANADAPITGYVSIKDAGGEHQEIGGDSMTLEEAVKSRFGELLLALAKAEAHVSELLADNAQLRAMLAPVEGNGNIDRAVAADPDFAVQKANEKDVS